MADDRKSGPEAAGRAAEGKGFSAGGRSPCASGCALRHAAHQRLQRIAFAVLQGLLQHAQGATEEFGLLEDFLAVGDQHVAPHRRIAGRDAGEVAKARAGQAQEFLGLFLLQDAGEVGKGQQVGKWLTAAKAASCASGVITRTRAPSAPEGAGLLDQLRPGLGQGVRMTCCSR
jgi:hypothetical protein